MQEIIVLGIPIAITCGLIVEGIKRAGVSKRWLVLISMAIGIGLMFVLWPAGMKTGDIVIAGILAGATASGIYSGGKKMLNASDTTPTRGG